MPKYQYLGCGQTVSKTSKAGNQYLQRCVYLAPILKDGGTASSINVYLMGDLVTIPDSQQLTGGDLVFVDFTNKGYVDDFRKLPK
jgi:hypothetical protein